MAEEVILGGYRRVNVLQTGQNSEVWEVVELASGQRFGMKLLLPERTHERAQRWFLRHEAAVGKTMVHPKIIRFFKFVNDRHHPFILMEFFPSQNLKLRMMRGQQDAFLRPKLRKIIEQTAQALEFVHSKRWVHRDVKPDNILVNGSGEVRLIDFALAVRASTGFFRRFRRKGGVTAGTRSYMSPEQIRGHALDCRADIYSFGVMLYEMVTGRLPFTGVSGSDLLKKHLFAEVPLIGSERNVTPEFDALLQKMLKKREKDRPENLGEVLNTLRRIKIYKDEVEPVAEPGMYR